MEGTFHNTIIVGGGQAGLSLGHFLRQCHDDFLILDAGAAVGDSWRQRYDSLVLFTPAQYNSLPGMAFPGEFDTYPTKEQVAHYIADYAIQNRLPVQCDTRVLSVRTSGRGFVLETTRGTYRATQVVIAVGMLQRAVTPHYASHLPANVFQLHTSRYRNPSQLPPGDTLVVGAGNSGVQIAAELSRKHKVFLAISKPPFLLPQRFLGRDLYWWITGLGIMDAKVGSWPWGRAIQSRNPIVGRKLRWLLRDGSITPLPRVIGAEGDHLQFADGSRRSFSNVIWATGYDYYFEWVHAPVFDAQGRLVHRRGVTAVPGLYFLGLRWLHTGGSGFMGFVGRDAAYLSTQMTPKIAKRAGAADGEPDAVAVYD